MDPLSITASIITVLQAANSVISFSFKLRNDIQNHANELASLTREIKELRNVLEDLADVAELGDRKANTTTNNERRGHLHCLSLLCGPGAALDICYKDLITLKKNLSKEYSRGRIWWAVARAVGWSKTNEDIQSILIRLDRYKNTFQLALAKDEARLIVQINNLLVQTSREVTDIQESVYAFFESYKYNCLDEQRRKIFLWLSDANPTVNHTEALKNHQEGTCSWFLDSSQFRSWLKYENRFLWINGPPGAGKTVLSAFIIDSLLKTSTTPTTAVSYFYCDFRRPSSQKAQNLVGSLAAQLCFQTMNTPDWLKETYSRSHTFTGSIVPPDEKFLAQALFTLTKELNKKVYIVLDALDECNDRDQLLSFLHDLAATTTNVSVIATSRNTKDIRMAFQNSLRLTLDDSSSGLVRDIKLYIDTRFQTDPNFAWLKQEIRNEILEKLLLDSEKTRMFRWVQCQLNEISCLRQINAVRTALNELPHGLEDSYKRILQNVPIRNRKIVQRCLLWLSFSLYPMTLDELREAIAIDIYHSRVDEGELLSSSFDIIDMCGGLVVTSKIRDTVTLVHLSVKEYLLSTSILETEVRSFALSKDNGYRKLTTFCLCYLSSTEFQTGAATTLKAWAQRNVSHPFLEHAARVWPQYAILARQPDEMVSEIKQFFELKSRKAFMSWVQVLNGDISWDDYPPWGHPLYYSASFGLDKVVSLLIQEDPSPISINKPGSRYGGTALHGAVLREHAQVIKLLLEASADPNRCDHNHVPPLHTAVIYGNIEVVSLLLEYGAQVDKCFNGQDPLQVARTYGQFEIADIIVRYKRHNKNL